jgi:hypothetical protein
MPVADARRDGVPFVVEDVAEDDVGSFADEQAGLSLPLPARGAGDDRDLAIDSTHCCLHTRD